MDKVPQTAWKIINEVKKNAVPTDKIEFINRNEWYNHFRNLLQPDSNHFDKNRKEQVISELHKYEKLNSVNANMDHDLTEKEVIDDRRKLKNNKASAQGLIKNQY